MLTWSKKTSLATTPIRIQQKRMHGLLRRFFCMSKKNLNAEGLLNELKGNSSFFPARPSKQPQEEQEHRFQEPEPLPETTPLAATTKQASEKASKGASTQAAEAFIEETRKILKLLGKEVIYVRSTQEEKDQIGDIVYTLKRQGMKTSDNEICRIAINIVLAEYKTNGEQSVLGKVLKALHT